MFSLCLRYFTCVCLVYGLNLSMKSFFVMRLKSFGYAFNGVVEVVRSQANMKIHLVGGVVAIFLGFVFQVKTCEWLAIIICCGLVFAAEAMNTALENVVDLVSPNYHELAGKAKDAAAASVLWVAATALVVGLLIFLPKIPPYVHFLH